jgi:cation:H+ antiporter
LFAAVIAYTVFIIRLARRESAEVRESVEILGVPAEKPGNIWLQLVLAGAGIAMLVVGARMLVDNATLIASRLGVSETIIGLTLVAAGTSLPELATSLVAAFRGQRDIALGNVIGSNIFNILAILGLTAIVTPIPVEPRFLSLDVPIMLGVSLTLIALVWRHSGIARLPALGFVAAYAAYIGYSGAV